MRWRARATRRARPPCSSPPRTSAQRGERFLLVEEQTPEGIRFNQPAGHLDTGESLLQAVVRETQEETAWHFVPDALVGVYRWQRAPQATTFLRFCFCGECTSQETDQPLDTGIVRSVWLTKDEIMARRDRLRSPLVLRCLDDYLAGCRFPLILLRDLA